MSKVRRKFDKEFKLAAVRMVTEDKLSKVEVARRLGVNPTQIRQWVQEIISEGPEQSFPGNGKLTWRTRPVSRRKTDEFRVISLIEKVHMGSRNTYGSPRIHAVLTGMGENCSKPKVARLMRLYGIRAKTKRKFKATTNSKHHLPVASNVLSRDFTPKSPNKSWAGDITYIWTREGWLYLSVILDLYSRKGSGLGYGTYPEQGPCHQGP